MMLYVDIDSTLNLSMQPCSLNHSIYTAAYLFGAPPRNLGVLRILVVVEAQHEVPRAGNAL